MKPLYNVLLEQEDYIAPKEVKEIIPSINELKYNKNMFNGFDSLLFKNLKVTTNETKYFIEYLLTNKPNNFIEYLSMNERKDRVTNVTFHFKLK